MEQTVHDLESAFAAIDGGVMFLDVLQDSSKPDEDTRIKDEGAAKLAEKIASCHGGKLKSLNLYNQGLTAKGVASLCAVLSSTHLVKLRLGANEFGDEGCQHLAAALPHTKMTNLDLFGNGITDAGLRMLLFASPPTLMGVTLENNKLSGDGKTLLKDWNFNPKAWRMRHHDEMAAGGGGSSAAP
jgi:Ran GTPase-activating protein (RanGAP) involved in mRNA processing and transport